MAIEATQWPCLSLILVDDFVELNFSDRNYLDLIPNLDTTLVVHRVCPEALTFPPRTAENPTKLATARQQSGNKGTTRLGFLKHENRT
jgi:hypothetical protein